MYKKILIWIVIVHLIMAPINTVVSANPLISIGANALKSAVRPLVGSVIVKQGVRTVEKTALKKAEERWFSRLAKEQVESIEKAAKRAEPVAGKKGWVRTAIGVGLWLTGVDLVFELADFIAGGSNVDRYTDEPLSTDNIMGQYGLSITYPSFPPSANVTYKITLVGHLAGPNDYIFSGTYTPKSEILNLTVLLKTNEHYSWVEMRHRYAGSSQVYVDRLQVRTEHINFNANKMYLVTSPMTDVTVAPAMRPVPVANPYPDIWPNDDKVVYIEYPDPALHNNPEQAVIDNTDAITDPKTNPNPNPNPDPGTNPTDPDKKPDEESKNWADKLKVLVSTKFPFSLPWDLYNMFSLLLAEPVRPSIEVNQYYMGMPFKFSHDFDYLDPYMPYFRSFIVISFCIYLIHKTRTLLGGGQ